MRGEICAFLFPIYQEDTAIAAKTNNQAINEEINFEEVRVIGNDGSQLGLMPSAAALAMAKEQNLDLVLIAPQATPPVCKIMDFGKYRFEQQKREKEASKKQKTVELKEIRLGLNIDVHDFETKAAQARKFFAGGDKVKATIRFRGREMTRTDRGAEVMKRFAETLEDIAVVDKAPKLEGRSMMMIMSAKPASKAKKQQPQQEV